MKHNEGEHHNNKTNTALTEAHSSVHLSTPYVEIDIDI